MATTSTTSEIDWTPKARAVLAAASELFYERGIAAVGVDAVAERAGVTKKTLYDRFGSKERLVTEYLRDRDQQWRARLEARLSQAGEDPHARVAAVFEVTATWAAERSWKGCALVNAHPEISAPDHPDHPGAAVVVAEKRWLVELFVDAATAAGCEQPREVGEQLAILHEGALVTSGLGVVAEAFARAQQVALDLLSRAARAATSGSSPAPRAARPGGRAAGRR